MIGQHELLWRAQCRGGLAGDSFSADRGLCCRRRDRRTSDHRQQCFRWKRRAELSVPGGEPVGSPPEPHHDRPGRPESGCGSLLLQSGPQRRGRNRQDRLRAGCGRSPESDRGSVAFPRQREVSRQRKRRASSRVREQWTRSQAGREQRVRLHGPSCSLDTDLCVGQTLFQAPVESGPLIHKPRRITWQ